MKINSNQVKGWLIVAKSKPMKRLAKTEEIKIDCSGPFTDDEISDRDDEYPILSKTQFAKKYRKHVFVPATITIDKCVHPINFNFCANPFCKWYGQPQVKYNTLKHRPSRYKLISSIKGVGARLDCNPINDPSLPGEPLPHDSYLVSNWSVSEEIRRLIGINTVVPKTEKYEFHRDRCLESNKNPFESPEKFYKRGKSTSNSQKFQCRECRKITNVLPSVAECFNYNQKENSILLDLMKDIFARTPVRRTCEKLGIAPKTYYSKLEIIYRRCLEFLEYKETAQLANMHFDRMYLNTDALIYHLNNVRRKGKGAGKSSDGVDKKLPTYIISSADSISGYVFRSDVAYDWEFDFEKLQAETAKFHCDHSFDFLRKNERYRYPFYPQPPTQNDEEGFGDYLRDLDEIRTREDYVKGCHVKTTYTAIAHYWLLRQALSVDKWYFSSDDDTTLQGAILRAFVDEIKSKDSHYFVCQCDKNITLEEAGRRYFDTRNSLVNWSKCFGYDKLPVTQQARLWYEDFLNSYDLYDYVNVNGVVCPVPKKDFFKSPLSTKDEGYRWIKSITDTRNIPADELAKVLVHIGNWATNNYYQELHRRVSLLERPLTTARGDGKSYIYANYNPKYAQQLVTIFRTLYNFCWKRKKGKNPQRLTPAQRLGIADKAYDLKDILYFK